MAEIRTEGLTHVYSAGTPFEQTAIEDVSLTIPAGQLAAVIGHTGSGKSTFIQHLDALLQPTRGRVLLDGGDINRDKYTRRDVKWKVGLVFQYPEYQLFEETVYRDIAFGPRNMKLSEGEIDERVREAARFTGVDEALFERSPLELGSTPRAARSFSTTSAATARRAARPCCSSATAWTRWQSSPSASSSSTADTSPSTGRRPRSSRRPDA